MLSVCVCESSCCYCCCAAAACAISRPDPSIMLNHASWRLLRRKKFKLRLLQMNGATLTHTHTHTHTLLSGMHSFRSTTIVNGHRDRRRTSLQQVDSSVARSLLTPPLPFVCSSSPARFLFPDLHFNWFLSSVLKSLANVFGEHVFYANISSTKATRRGPRYTLSTHSTRGTRTAVAPDTLQIFIEHDF